MTSLLQLLCFCRNLKTRYVNMSDKQDPNVFWPGQLLRALRCYLDEEDMDFENPIFYSPRKDRYHRSNPQYNNNIKTWPVNDRGFVQYGTIPSAYGIGP